MLKYFFIFTFLLSTPFLFAQSSGKFTTNYHLEVQFTDVVDQEAVLAYYLGSKQYVSDTVKIDSKGTALFKSNGLDTLNYGIYIVYLPEKESYFEFLMTEPKIVLRTSIADPVTDMQVIQSDENKLFNEYLQFLGNSRKRAESIKTKIANNPTDSVALKQQLNAIDTEVKDYIDSFIQKNEGTFAAKTVKANKQVEIPSPPPHLKTMDERRQFQYKYYYKHYWDYTDLSDERIIFTPWLEPRINTYLTKLTLQHPDSIVQSADRLIDLAKENKFVHRYLVQYITNFYANSKLMTAENVYVHMVSNYYTAQKAWWADDITLSKMKRRAATIEPLQIGKQFPNFVLETPEKSLENLQNKLSNYTVLFFYDPTCGHCKKDAPKMETTRQSLADKGVNFWGVALDIEDSQEGIEQWKTFIEDKGLTQWTNVADLKGTYALLARYDIRSTPMIYVLDSKGEIVLKRIGAEQLGKILGDFIVRNEK